ncbi:MAG: hypothetical protein J6P73_05480 [Bacteroidales bacterium]|nr:hypothetical protein [Bacteroidales bacterium]
MGGGFYSFDRASARSVSYQSQSREQIFSNRSIDPLMVIKDKVRESCDSEEHPTSYPVIIGLDVTGSMGRVPENLIKEAFPEIMKTIMEKGVEHAQICFVGIGDHYSDQAHIQVGQFETSDELTEKWLKAIYIEGGGGGNNGESYQLAWYFAAFHTKIDSFEKRGIKGTLITIGDEPCHASISGKVLKQLFGEGEGEILTSELLKEVQKKWDVYHINVNDYASERYNSPRKWEDLVSDHLLLSESMESKEIGEILSTVIVSSYKKNVGAKTTGSSSLQHQL